MDNVKFNYVFGKPAEGQFGRWAEGNVVRSPEGHRLVAHLFYMGPGPTSGCQSFELDVPGPFSASAFASFLRTIDRGRFATATQELILTEADGLDPGTRDEISRALPEGRQRRLEGELAPEQFAALAAKLEQAQRRELLGQALARRARRTPSGG